MTGLMPDTHLAVHPHGMSWIPSVAPAPPADHVPATSAEAELQSQRMMADRMITIGALAAGVAHEINTPLTCALPNFRDRGSYRMGSGTCSAAPCGALRSFLSGPWP